MSDILEELLTDLREGAVREIRPPGAAAARRTVRRRRVTTAAASACAVLIAIGATFLLVTRPSTEQAPVLPAATSSSVPTSGPEKFAATALAAVDDGAAALEVAEPVVAGYRRAEVIFMPYLTLRVACVGAGGQITVVVSMDAPGERFDATGDKEVARVTLPCRADPVPVTRRFDSELREELTVRLQSTGSAAGQAGFAYRLTAQGGAPLAPNDPAADVATVLGMRDKTLGGGGGGPSVEPSDKLDQESRSSGFPDEATVLALACRGEGTYRIQFRHRDKVLADHTIRCSWPPRRVDFDLPEPLGEDVSVYTRYKAEEGQQAAVGWALHARE